MSKRLHFVLVLGLVVIFLVGVFIGLSQKSFLLGDLLHQPVVSQQTIPSSDILEIKDFAVNPAKINANLYEESIVKYTITKESQVTVWIEDSSGTVLKVLRPMTVVSPGIFTDKWDGRIAKPGAFLGHAVTADTYNVVVMAVDVESDQVVQERSEVEVFFNGAQQE